MTDLRTDRSMTAAPSPDGTAGYGLAPDARVLALIPHFACRDWLAGAIESLLAQTRPLAGIVVIDDASEDPPIDIVARYPQVTLLHAEDNVGPYRLVQQVVDSVDHDAFLFQDADDWSAPDRLERLLRASEAADAGLVGCDYVLVDTFRWSAQLVLFPLDANAALATHPTGHVQQHPTGLVARTLIDRLGGYATGMRFSGDDEFLRRAAHVTPIVNVPRPMYYRRHRSESLTTAAATGHGSPARRAVLAEMGERARANIAAVAAGDPPELSPLRSRGPVSLRHLSGPTLAELSATVALGTEAVHGAERVEVATRAPGRPSRRRPAAPPAASGAQIVLIGTPDSGASALAASLAQHPAIDFAGDVSWVADVGAGLTGAADAADTSSKVMVPGTRPGTQLDALAVTAAALTRLVGPAVDAAILGGGTAQDAALGDDAQHAAALQAIARTPLTGARRWVGWVPAGRTVLARLIALFPDVTLIHVTRDVDDVAHLTGPEDSPAAAAAVAAWERDLEVLLDLEAAVGDRVQRVSLRDLVTDPADTLATILDALGEDYVPAVTEPFDPAQAPHPSDAHPSVPHTTRRLSTALLGPANVAAPSAALARLTEAPAGTPQSTAGAAPTPAAGTPVAPPALQTTPSAPSGPAKAPAAAPPPVGPAVGVRPGVSPGARPMRRGHRIHPSVPAAVTLVDRNVPAGQVVAVVSRGDDALLRFKATGRHLPAASDGRYAGYHPADGDEALGHLAAARDAGARYLLIPSTSSWWLTHYRTLAAHLEATAARSAELAGHVLFDLAPEAPAADTPVPAPAVDAATTTAPALPAAAPERHAPALTGRARPKVHVLSWSVSHNPYGRAHLLADVLSEDFDVELVGATFDRFGGGIWQPLATSTHPPLRSFPGGPFPEYLARMEEMAATLEGDAIVVSKPRLPSYMLGILAKLQRNRPLILDVDDRELTFVNATSAMTLPEVAALADNDAIINPFGGPWTRYCDHLISSADAVTVSNAALQDVYGGTIIGHARNERVFDPARWPRKEVRARYGFAPDERILLFGGTPRRHKGIVDIAAALREIGDPRLKLCLIQTAELDELRGDLDDFADWIRTVPYQAMADLPALVAAADAVCVLQNPDSPVAQFQIPAKLTDALALQTPILTTSVPPLAALAATGALALLDGPLSEGIAALFDDYPAALARAEVGREVFLDQLSYRAVRPQLRAVVEAGIASPRRVPAEFRRAVALQRDLFAPPQRSLAPPPEPGQTAALSVAPTLLRRSVPDPDGIPATFDVVLFWKQNDTGVYGRRHDMLLDQLARSPRVRRIVQFDHPIGVGSVQRLATEPHPSHGQLLHAQILSRLAGDADDPELIRRTFVYENRGKDDPGRASDPHPPKSAHIDFVRDTLAAHHVGGRDVGRRDDAARDAGGIEDCEDDGDGHPLILWGYPKHFDLPDLINALEPDLVIMDVVDDHRTWRPEGVEHDEIAAHYAEVLARADVTLTNCEPMRAEMAALSDTVRLVPNGCQWPAPAGDGIVPDALVGLPRPLVGYVGNLSARLDIALLEKVARARPDWTLVFVGSSHAGQDALVLDDYPNVHFVGPRSDADARAFIDSFDVAIIPHVDDEMTRRMHPLKVFVYCSRGVPVVTTAIGNLDELAALVHVGYDADSFIAAIDAALDEGRQPLDDGAQRLLAAHAWTTRMAQIEQLLDDAWRRR
jgi:glycosyltransferase involved in cell wall biosynthesis